MADISVLKKCKNPAYEKLGRDFKCPKLTQKQSHDFQLRYTTKSALGLFLRVLLSEAICPMTGCRYFRQIVDNPI